MRGTLWVGLLGVDHPGIIPADAGSTSEQTVRDRERQDHPRGCGEHWVLLPPARSASGSSPRMRGAQRIRDRPLSGQGIIPADAGSTLPPIPRPCSTWDHPRGCGEHSALFPPAKSASGSSPRMRGARKTGGTPDEQDRIIPADAGSTFSRRTVRTTWWDHPRGCGEHTLAVIWSRLHPGSSPRMRGARRLRHAIPVSDRIIPADAGSTSLSNTLNSRGKDHPRGCGEHCVCRGHYERIGRIIPADAGSTTYSHILSYLLRDHPRGCGEHFRFRFWPVLA